VRGRGGCLGLGVWLGSLCESSYNRPTGRQYRVRARSNKVIWP